ncbi:uncharacterized mitochondrial protein AtMg00860-like [Homarus americanus]|uniref:uncharacterized mitochondrial protein AtMg00860-like n=1 Tax=Homarus americanus TaxID=6706 RepID=UPI001C453AD9|nr:uncharacterized mitochondrial protein AtMg00860-like [Homarus americanus]
MTNRVACFQRVIDEFIRRNELLGTFAYIDITTIAASSQQEHDENLSRFLEVAKKSKFTFNEDKSVFSATSIDLLGYTISHGTLKPDADRLRPLKELPLPKDSPALRVIGLLTYYYRWISHFSDKVRPLVKAKIFLLQGEAVSAFENLKVEIASAVISSIDEKIPFVVKTDVSDSSIAASLNQAGKPVTFSSRTFSDSEFEYRRSFCQN